MKTAMLSTLRAILLSCLCLACIANAQDTSAPTDKDEDDGRGRRAWIIATSLPEGVESPVKVLAGGVITEVKLMKRAAGKSVKVDGDGMVHLIKPITNKEGKLAYERHASAQIPAGVEQSLIILFPMPNLTPPLKFASKVIDLDKFRGGDAMFINLTSMQVGVTVGSGKTIIDSGRLEIINSEKFTGTKNMELSYHWRTPGQKSWNLISASTAAFRAQRREILIFTYDTQLGQIDYHGISFEALP